MTIEIHFGSLYVDRIDVTGYTRMTVEAGEPEYGRYVVTTEWVAFDTPLPIAKPEAAAGRLFRFYDREAGRQK